MRRLVSASVSLLRTVKQAFRRWHLGFQVERRNPGVVLEHPIFWRYDTVEVISLGRGVSIGPFSEIVVAAQTPSSRVKGELRVGEGTYIGPLANIRAAGGRVLIGSNCLIAQNVSIIAANHEVWQGGIYRDLPWDETATGVTLEDNCWIGAGAILLPGITIGANAVIAAGSVVTKSVPPNEIWGNIPARKLMDVPTKS